MKQYGITKRLLKDLPFARAGMVFKREAVFITDTDRFDNREANGMILGLIWNDPSWFEQEVEDTDCKPIEELEGLKELREHNVFNVYDELIENKINEIIQVLNKLMEDKNGK